MTKFLNKNIYIVLTFGIIFVLHFLLFGDRILYSVLLLILLISVFLIYIYHEYLLILFVASLFVDFYFAFFLRLQFSTLISYGLVIAYLINPQNNIYTSFRVPFLIKLSGFCILVAVTISSTFTKYLSIKSIYLGYTFAMFILGSYVIFKSLKSTKLIDSLLNYFVLGVFCSSVIIIIQIFLTGNLRSLGVTGYPIMDFSAIALVIIFFFYYLLGKPNLKINLIAVIIFVVFITTQSRFAWLGFTLALIYGILLSLKKSPDTLQFLKKRLTLGVLIFILLIIVSVFFNLDRIILYRFSDVSFEFFQSNERGELITNSLETRILIWIVALNTFSDNMLTGIGYLMFNFVSEDYNILPQFLYDTFVKEMDAHTTMLNFLVETGIVGLISFLFYVFSIFFLSFKSINLSHTSQERKLSITLNILIFFIIVHSIYSGAFTFSTNAYNMHFIFALCIGNFCLLSEKYGFSVTKEN